MRSRPSNLILSGLPRIGKTTVVQKLLAIFERDFGGYYTQALEKTFRSGYRLVTVSGRERIPSLLPLIQQFDAPNLMGLRPDELRHGACQALEQALERHALLIIDEVGRLETWVPEIRDLVRRCLDAPQLVVATMPARPEDLPDGVDLGFLDEIRSRDDVEMHSVTAANRSSLAETLAGRICEILGPYGDWGKG